MTTTSSTPTPRTTRVVMAVAAAATSITSDTRQEFTDSFDDIAAMEQENAALRHDLERQVQLNTDLVNELKAERKAREEGYPFDVEKEVQRYRTALNNVQQRLTIIEAEIERVAKRYEDEGMHVMATSLRALKPTSQET